MFGDNRWDKFVMIGCGKVLRAMTVAVTLSWAVLPSVGSAASVYWTGATNNLWSNSGNWSGGTPSGSNDVFFVNTTGTPTNYNPSNVDSATGVKNITFNTSIAGPVTLTGSQLSVTSTLTDQCTTDLVTIQNNVALNVGGVSNGFYVVSTGARLKITGNILSGNTISINAGPTQGMLWLTGNNASGAHNVYGGILRTASTAVSGGLSSSNLSLGGGSVLETQGELNRYVGNTTGRVQWGTGGGGFSAYGGSLLVDLDQDDVRDTFTWGGSNFVSATDALVFGSIYSDNEVQWYDHINLQSSTAAVTRTIKVVDNPNATADRAKITGNLTNSGTGVAALSKTGGGILELAGTNSHKGTTTVSEGTLLVSGSLDSRTTAVTVASGAKLGGSGTISRPVVVNGTVMPGMSVETLDTGDLTINDGASYEWELGTSLALYDSINVTGSLTLPNGGTITLKLYDLSGGVLDPTGEEFELITWSGADPMYTNATWVLDYGTTGWSNGSVEVNTTDNKVVLRIDGPDVVPEPATMVLLALGAVGLILRRRKR